MKCVVLSLFDLGKPQEVVEFCGQILKLETKLHYWRWKSIRCTLAVLEGNIAFVNLNVLYKWLPSIYIHLWSLKIVLGCVKLNTYVELFCSMSTIIVIYSHAIPLTAYTGITRLHNPSTDG